MNKYEIVYKELDKLWYIRKENIEWNLYRAEPVLLSDIIWCFRSIYPNWKWVSDYKMYLDILDNWDYDMPYLFWQNEKLFEILIDYLP